MSRKRKLWLIGLVVAAVGVLLAKVVAPRYTDPLVQLVLFGVGVILAIGGLGVIMAGMRKDLK